MLNINAMDSVSADPPPPYCFDDSEHETEELNRKVAATIDNTIRMTSVVRRSETSRTSVRFEPMAESIPRNSTSSVRSNTSLSSDGYSATEPMMANTNRNANTNAASKKSVLLRPSTINPDVEQCCCFSETGGCCFSTTNGCCFSTNGGCCCSEGEGCCFSEGN